MYFYDFKRFGIVLSSVIMKRHTGKVVGGALPLTV
jgi:hypothetical protein